MTIEDIKQKIKEIQEVADDDEMAHVKEDILYYDVVAFVANGGQLTQEMAKEILTTKKIDFARWCA